MEVEYQQDQISEATAPPGESSASEAEDDALFEQPQTTGDCGHFRWAPASYYDTEQLGDSAEAHVSEGFYFVCSSYTALCWT